MQIQEIVNEIIAQVEANLQLVSGKKIKGFGLGIKDINGAVVEATSRANGERKYIGIADNIGPFFYIRYTGIATARKLAQGEQIGACDGNYTTVPLRIVFIYGCSDAQKLLLALQRALFNSNLSKNWKYGQKAATLNEKSFSIIPWDIFSEETGKKKTEFKTGAIELVSIDFDLRFKINYNNCTEIKLC